MLGLLWLCGNCAGGVRKGRVGEHRFRRGALLGFWSGDVGSTRHWGRWLLSGTRCSAEDCMQERGWGTVTFHV